MRLAVLKRYAALLAVACSVALPAGASGQSAGAGQSEVAVKRDPAEVAYVAVMDKAIAAAREPNASAEQLALLRDAIKAAGARDGAKAREIRTRIEDPAAQKLVDWQRLRLGLGDSAEYKAFLDGNPHWPERVLLGRRMEEAVFAQAAAGASIKDAFRAHEPQTAAGLAAVAVAALAGGDKEKARALAVKLWREHDIPAAIEAGVVDKLGSLLTPADHKWRLDTLLIDAPRWIKERKEREPAIRRQIARLAEADRKKAEARLAVFLHAANAQALMDAVPAEATKEDWGFLYHRIQLLRRASKVDEGAKLLLGAPTDKSKTVVPDEWWHERRLLAYGALKAGRPQLAYDLVHDAGPLNVNPLKEQTFMAGWLALRLLNSPQNAQRHFTAMRKAADGPLSVAKSEYWLGRTNEALGKREQATQNYRSAAEKFDTFHGQLARQKLAKGAQGLPVKPPAVPSAAEIKAFNDNDAVRATVLARKAGLDSSIVRLMLGGLRNGLKSEAEIAMNAHLAEALGDTQMAVRIGKTAIAGGKNLITYAYPVHPFPSYKPLRDPPELAFLLGIARQESEFNTMTVSGAGAKGLLQVMAVTAKHVCRDYKIKCELDRLLTDKPYNTMLASAYIGDRMAEFAGSYVLSLAGYNAGPGRARQWIREFGDPRDPKVDPLDWIERIPFTETREYVAKVLSNIQIYRARLGEGDKALRLEEDLLRARGKTALPAAGQDADDAGTAGGAAAGGG